MTQPDYSMLYIETEKARLQAEMKKLRQSMKERTENLFAPPVAETRTQRVMNTIERGVALWEGLWMGYKVIKMLGFFMPGKRKRK